VSTTNSHSLASGLKEFLSEGPLDDVNFYHAVFWTKRLNEYLSDSFLSHLQLDEDELAKSNTGRKILFSVDQKVVLTPEQEQLARGNSREIDYHYAKTILLKFADKVLAAKLMTKKELS